MDDSDAFKILKYVRMPPSDIPHEWPIHVVMGCVEFALHNSQSLDNPALRTLNTAQEVAASASTALRAAHDRGDAAFVGCGPMVCGNPIRSARLLALQSLASAVWIARQSLTDADWELCVQFSTIIGGLSETPGLAQTSEDVMTPGRLGALAKCYLLIYELRAANQLDIAAAIAEVARRYSVHG